MTEKEKKTPIKKVKLNYKSAVSHTPPVDRIPVPASHMEELSKSIQQKTKQNADQFNWARENFKYSIVR